MFEDRKNAEALQLNSKSGPCMNIDHEVQAAGLRQDKMRTILAE